MLLGPVFRYELYSIARRTRYFWLRGIFGLALLAVMWMCYTSYTNSYQYRYRSGQPSIDDTARLADAFFKSFAWIATLAIVMIGPALSAGVIATERERRTIEYLFATDLRNSEIVLSKLAARLLSLGILLLTALPILAIFRLMGGIAGDRLLACFLMLASTGVLVTTTAIAISVWSPRGRDALSRVYLVLIAILLLPLILSGIAATGVFGQLSWFGDIFARIVGWLYSINPFGSLISMMSGVDLDLQMIWRMLVAHFVLSLALTALAVSAVRRVHLRSAGSGEGSSQRRKLTFELPRWRRPLGDNAMLWKEIFARTAATKLGVLGRIAMFLILAGLFWWLGYAYLDTLQNRYNHSGYSYRYSWFDEAAVVIGTTIGSGMLLLCGARAASLVTYEKERDTWLSILSTPMTGREIITAKLLGNLYAFRWLVVVLLVIWGMAGSLNPTFLQAVPYFLATIFLVACFCTLLGLMFSLRLSSSLRASSATMATLFFMGGGYIFCCCMPIMPSRPSAGIEHVIFAPCVPYLIYAPTDFLDDGSGADEEFSNYVVGMIGYSFVTILLWASLTTSFDEWAGRISGNRQAPELTPTETATS